MKMEMKMWTDQIVGKIKYKTEKKREKLPMVVVVS